MSQGIIFEFEPSSNGSCPEYICDLRAANNNRVLSKSQINSQQDPPKVLSNSKIPLTK